LLQSFIALENLYAVCSGKEIYNYLEVFLYWNYIMSHSLFLGCEKNIYFDLQKAIFRGQKLTYGVFE